MVIVSPRMQAGGTARRLRREVLLPVDQRTIRLVATAAGRRPYETEEFRATGIVLHGLPAARPRPRDRPLVAAERCCNRFEVLQGSTE